MTCRLFSTACPSPPLWWESCGPYPLLLDQGSSFPTQTPAGDKPPRYIFLWTTRCQLNGSVTVCRMARPCQVHVFVPIAHPGWRPAHQGMKSRGAGWWVRSEAFVHAESPPPGFRHPSTPAGDKPPRYIFLWTTRCQLNGSVTVADLARPCRYCFRTNDEVVGWRAIAGPHHPRRFAKRPYSERMIWLMRYDIFVWDPKGARSV